MIVKIGDVISEYSVRNKFDENIPVYSVTNEKGFCTGYFSKEVASKDKSTYKIVPRGYFAYNPSRINVGSVDWQKYEDRVIVSPLYVVFGVSDRLDRQYLLHYLKSDMMLSFIKEYATGSVRDNLKLADLGKFPINLRPVEEQRQIAATLDKIDELIAKRRQQLDKLDELIKSRFMEMFGDPIDNTMGLRSMPLGEACYLKAGITTSADAIHDQSAEYPVPCYGGNGIRGYVEKATQSGCYPIVGRQGALCGNVQLVTGEFHATEHAVLVTPIIEANVVWLFHLLKLMDLYRFHTGAAQPGLAVKTLNTVTIPIADIHAQEQFAAFVAQTDKSKSTIQKSLEKLEILKKALLQKYFG